MSHYVNARVKDGKSVGGWSAEEEQTLAILKEEGLFVHRAFLHDRGLKIGRGAFGKIQLATLHLPLPTKVAVKSMLNEGGCKGRQEMWSLLREGFRMKDLDHVNVLSVIAVSMNSKGLPMLVTPFMANGDVRSYIIQELHQVSVRQLLEFGIQIGRGMVYLEDNAIIHRDLAARNCLLDEKLVVKIGDFGMSRCPNKSSHTEYYVSQEACTPLPIRWMAPESIQQRKYSHKSDVWSLGVVLWELLTRGETPYTHVELWNSQLLKFLLQGNRLSKPTHCPPPIYDLMQQCWQMKAKDRPSFAHIVAHIQRIL